MNMTLDKTLRLVTVHRGYIEKGKTILSDLLEMREPGEKILIYVGTIEEMDVELKDWATIRKNTGEELTVLPLLDREEICCKQQITERTLFRCDPIVPPNKILKQLNKLKSDNAGLLEDICSEILGKPRVSNFKNILLGRDDCGYYSGWSMLDSSDIIITSNLKDFARIERMLRITLKRMHIMVGNNFSREIHGFKRHYLLLFMKIFYEDEFLQEVYDSIKGFRIFHWGEISVDKRKKVLGVIGQILAMVRCKSEKLNKLPARLLRDDFLERMLVELIHVFSASGTFFVAFDTIIVLDIEKDLFLGKVLMQVRKT